MTLSGMAMFARISRFTGQLSFKWCILECKLLRFYIHVCVAYASKMIKNFINNFSEMSPFLAALVYRFILGGGLGDEAD